MRILFADILTGAVFGNQTVDKKTQNVNADKTERTNANIALARAQTVCITPKIT